MSDSTQHDKVSPAQPDRMARLFSQLEGQRRVGVSQPRVSVCISAYNHEAYIGDCLDSVLAQDCPDIEILVVDDASTDGTARIIQQYADRHPGRIKALLLDSNLGPAQAPNRLFRQAQGEFIALLGSDDLMRPGRLSKQLAFLLSHPAAVAVFSEIDIIDGEGRIQTGNNPYEPLFNSPYPNIYRRLLEGNFLNAPSVMLRRADLLAVGGYGESLRYVQDFDLWVKLLQRGELHRLPERLTAYRVHGKNLSVFTGPSNFQVCAETVAVIVRAARAFPLEKFCDRPPQSAEERAVALITIARHLEVVDRNHFGQALLGTACAYELALQAWDAAPEVGRAYKQELETRLASQLGGGSAPPQLAEHQAGARVLVILHLYYTELWPELRAYLSRINLPFDLVVSTPPSQLDWVDREVRSAYPHARIFACDNRGRDIAPLFSVLRQISLDGYAYVLKLHTKRSPHLGWGDTWRQQLLDSLLPAGGGVASILQMLDQHPEVGLLGAAQHILDAKHYSGAGGVELERMNQLAGRLGFDLRSLNYDFVAASMFWCRPLLLRSLLEIGIKPDDFEEERGQVEGTLAHAMERVFPLAGMKVGLRTAALLDQGIGLRLGNWSQNIAYMSWLAARRLRTNQAQLFDRQIEAWDYRPDLLPVIIDRDGNIGAVVESIKNLTSQLFAPERLLIISAKPAPRGAEGGKVNWLTVAPEQFLNALQAPAVVGAADWLYLLPAGDLLAPETLLLLATAANEHRDWVCAYVDEDHLHPDGNCSDPVLKPDFNLDLLRSQAYIGQAFACRADFLARQDSTGMSLDGLSTELSFRAAEQHGLIAVGHIPQVLHHARQAQASWRRQPQVQAATRAAIGSHLARMGADAQVLGLAQAGNFRTVYQHAERPLVSIIIPTKNQFDILRRCIETLVASTSYKHYELLVVDNNTDSPDALAYLEGLAALDSEQVRILRYPHPFNFAAINNHAVEQARGDYVLLLNNDTAVVQADWLEQLLNHGLRPEVGAVGAKLLFPDGRIQHAGVVLGLRGPADHPFIGAAPDAAGYQDRMLVDQDYPVVTAACMLVRRGVYLEVGGMDEQHFKVSYNDVDLCLRIREAGYLTVWTPHAVLMHEGSVSQNQVDTAAQEAKRKRFRAEQASMYERWLPIIAGDPAYNRNLSLNGNGFELETNPLLSWRPLSWRPVPVIVAHPGDSQGCGNYRILKPFEALEKALMIDGGISWELFNPANLARIDPDTIVFQRQVNLDQFSFLEDAKRFSRAFKIFELDDYLINLPTRSVHRSHMPKDVHRNLRRAIAQTDRFVVSTDRLAEAMRDFHPNIHVVNNYLPPDWWSDLTAQRRVGRKPRVGWAGGISHEGDLDLIVDVVKELANEVEWVFMGMCPEKLRGVVHEFHPGVPITQYPAKLAALNLDLALAPLEQNVFNECKSNLRLLEYGACGFPVICSDQEPYRGDLPVRRVRNRFKDWVDAIREHLADLDTTAREGDRLRAAVRADWMLSDERLVKWLNAWRPD